MVPCPLSSFWEKLWPKKKMPRGEYVSSSFAECAPECGYSAARVRCWGSRVVRRLPICRSGTENNAARSLDT